MKNVKENFATVGEHYVHTLVEHNWTWKKFMMAVIVYVAAMGAVSAVLIGGLGLIVSALGHGAAYWDIVSGGNMEQLPFGLGNRIFDLALFAMFPAGMIANRLVFKSKGGNLMSVFGKTRWKWILHCLVILLPVMIVGMIAHEMILKPFTVEMTTKALVITGVTLILTPLQCMGEEMLFRGWALQILGPIFKNRKTTWLVFGVGMSIAFAVSHNAPNVFTTISMAQFGILACALIYITGGIEAGILMHSINNTVLFIISVWAKGGRDYTPSGAIGSYATKDALLGILMNFIYFAVVVWLWKRYQKKEQA